MELAYTIDQFIALDTAAGYFDLHNCYDVARVHREGTTCYVSPSAVVVAQAGDYY